MRLVHDSTILYYDVHESKVKARGVLKQYQKYLEWKDDLPQDLANIDDDDQMVPHVLSLQYCSLWPVVRSGALTSSASNTAPPWFFSSAPCCTWKPFPRPPGVTYEASRSTTHGRVSKSNGGTGVCSHVDTSPHCRTSVSSTSATPSFASPSRKLTVRRSCGSASKR